MNVFLLYVVVRMYLYYDTTELCKISINGIETINIKIMDKCKWNFKVLNHYVRLTVENRFIILGYRGENWKELVNINFTLC